MTQSKKVPTKPKPPYRSGLTAIFDVIERLRAADGCPWDREQTHESLRPYLLEETYELLEAIDSGDDQKIKEELGDVLLQVAMHSEIAAEQQRFDAAQVSEAAAAKMVRRHPHVFGDVAVNSADDVLRNWEHQKADEAKKAGRNDESVVDRVPTTLPALAWSLALQKRAARVGFDYISPKEAAASVAEEARELAEGKDSQAAFDGVGDLLLSMVSLSRKLKVNPEDALRVAARRFRDRFAKLEAQVNKEQVNFTDLSPKELQRRWDATR